MRKKLMMRKEIDYREIDMDFKRIKELRILYEYTQEYVAKQLGITRRTYSHYERGDYDIPTNVIIKLSELYGVTCDYLLNLSDSYYE